MPPRQPLDVPELERIPWSQLGPYFIDAWGHDEDGRLRGEHIEIAGQTGSGKSYVLATILQERAQVWDSAEIVILTKQSDDSIPLLGWPVASSVKELGKYKQVIFWPNTSATGEQREEHHEQQLYDLLSALWVPNSNVVLAFDEIGYVESLSRRLQKMIRMYWREGRSHNISVVAMKQRPVGVQRDQHSESRWKMVFAPADYADMDRFAELLGRRQIWRPVLESLDQSRHEFVIRNSVTKDAYITWIDIPLKPLPEQQNQKGAGTRETLFGRKVTDNEERMVG